MSNPIPHYLRPTDSIQLGDQDAARQQQLEQRSSGDTNICGGAEETGDHTHGRSGS